MIKRIFLEEYPKISPEEFAALPSKPYKQKVGKYSKEGILNSNKKVTEIVRKFLKENPEINSTNFNSRSVSGYVMRNIPGFAGIKAIESIENKYRDLDTFFGNLIYHLKGQ